MIKKKWYDVYAPKIFGGIRIGEILVTDPKTLTERAVEVLLSDIIQDPSKFYIKLKFKGDKLENEKLYTKFVGHECLRDYISHIVRRGVTRVDNNVIVTTKDEKKLRVKGILITSRRVNVSTKSKIIKAMDKVIIEYAGKTNFDDFVKDMVFGVIAGKIKKACKKIYPVSKVEIRKSHVLNK
ncbi:MAG: 30S ribosomal protein S3ae [Candidatus Aenigmarchaeota archaeon]|nr:30S ribosomal protein S3ae [Candidatus Aenigmarchaeota archaeon]